MNAQASTPTHRLDKALFWLRWLFLISATLLVLLADKTILDQDTPDTGALTVGLGVAVAGNLVIGLLALFPNMGDGLLGTANVLFDSALAALFFWVYDGAQAPLLVLGTLAMLLAAFRFGWRGVLLTLVILGLLSGLVVTQLDHPSDSTQVNWGLSLVFLGVFGVLGVVLRAGGWSAKNTRRSEDALTTEALRLRAARERAGAIYEMANTLSATLDYRRVLEAAQNIGTLGLREIGTDIRLVSAVLLFQGKDNKLRVITSRGLTRADQSVAVPGRRGVVGLALKQAEPVFGGDPSRDPELRYFVAFQEAKSVLAIPLRSGFENYGVMIFACDQPNAFTDDHIELMTAIGTQSTIALQNAVLYQNLLNEKERIVEVDEDARKKLARDLHDGPTQSVAAIAMRVNYIRRLMERQPQQAVEELWKVEDLARRTTKEIRHMLFTMRPLVLETQGLVAALETLADKMRDTHDTNVIIQATAEIEQHLDTNAQGVLFYIIEEAANNARKHAQSEHIFVRLYKRETYVVVEIEDDGVGFDVSAVDANYDQRGSLGMINMRERAELIEGTLRIQSAKGRGTKISILIPLNPAAGPGVQSDETSGPAPALDLQSQNRPPGDNGGR